MSAGIMTARQAVLRWRVVPAVLISLAAGLGPVWLPAQALAASQGAFSISSGGTHSCAIENGKAYCWGDNRYGQLGDGSTVNSSIPVAVDTSGVLAGKTLIQISADTNHTCAVDSNGAGYCWGDNSYGELGDGTFTNSPVPVAVDASGVLAGKTLNQISVGNVYDTCALDSTGAAYCWGDNGYGELGNGSFTASPVPVAVDTSGVLAGKVLTQISAGGFTDDSAEDTCALDSTGGAYCWGYNGYGELGDGSFTNSPVPVAVDASGVLAGKTLNQISAGAAHTCVLDSTGGAYCWGYNGYGELGDGSFTNSPVPVAVDTSGVLAGKVLTQISAASDGVDTCALDTTGTAYCWGVNNLGELGDGNTTYYSDVPIAVDTSGVLAGKTLAQISTGGYDHPCALDVNNAIYCWGDNEFGDLGNDSSSALSDVPVLVGPQAPANVTGAPGNAAAAVSWTAPASLDGGTLTGYTATASPGGETCTATSATTCTVTGLTNGTTYSITVVDHTTAGDSGASAPATVTPEPARLTGPIVSGYRAALCAADRGDSAVNDTPVIIATCDGSPGQDWTVTSTETLQIHGKCLDIYRDEKTNKAPVELYTCTGGANQQWHATNGTLVNPVSGKCLDDPRFSTTPGTRLEIYTCNGGANQQWKIP